MDRLVSAYIMARAGRHAEAVRDCLCGEESLRSVARRHGVAPSTLGRQARKVRAEVRKFVGLLGDAPQRRRDHREKTESPL
jgi:transposase-like protein